MGLDTQGTVLHVVIQVPGSFHPGLSPSSGSSGFVLVSLFLRKQSNYLFVCAGSQPWHSGSPLHHAGSRVASGRLGVVAHGLRCSAACGVLVP